jgi:hypothetical protein
MAIDPLSIGLGLGGLLLQQFQGKKATDAAKQNQALIQQGLSRADQTSAQQLASARGQAGELTGYARQNYGELLAQAMNALTGQNALATSNAQRQLSQARLGSGENLTEARRGAGENIAEARRAAAELRGVGEEAGGRLAAAARVSSNIQGRNRPLFDQLLQQAIDDYQYSQPKSEASRRDELTRLMSMATPAPAARVDQRGLATITQGGPILTPQQQLAQIMLKAREQAGKEFAGEQESGSKRRLGAIAQFGEQARLTRGDQTVLETLLRGNQGVSGAIESGGRSVLGAMGVGNKAIQDAIANQYQFASDAMKNINTAAGNVTQASALQKPDLAGTAALMRALGGTAAQNKATGGKSLLDSLFGTGSEGTTGTTTGARTGGRSTGVGRGRGLAGFGSERDAPFEDAYLPYGTGTEAGFPFGNSGYSRYTEGGDLYEGGSAGAYPSWLNETLTRDPGTSGTWSSNIFGAGGGMNPMYEGRSETQPVLFSPETALGGGTVGGGTTFAPQTQLDIYDPNKPLLDFFGGRRPPMTRF